MPQFTTDTSGQNLPTQGHYSCASVEGIVRKEIKGGFIIYEWRFTGEIDGQIITFKIGLFESQMGELLRALGAVEVSKDKFTWVSENYIGENLSFNIVHSEDKKGIIRAVLSDVNKVTAAPQKAMSPDEIWGEDGEKRT